MSALTTTNTVNTANLVETMQNLTSGAIGNLVTFAELLPELWADAPWTDNSDKTDVADFMSETFGIGSSRDGLLTLPQIALDAAIAAFVAEGTKLTYAQITALTGASRATVARASAKGGMSESQPQKSPTAGKSDETDTEDKTDKSDKSADGQTFDLGALLSALDDTELKSVLSTVGIDRVRKLIAA
jgi:hypothetical protein